MNIASGIMSNITSSGCRHTIVVIAPAIATVAGLNFSGLKSRAAPLYRRICKGWGPDYVSGCTYTYVSFADNPQLPHINVNILFALLCLLRQMSAPVQFFAQYHAKILGMAVQHLINFVHLWGNNLYVYCVSCEEYKSCFSRINTQPIICLLSCTFVV